MLYDPQKTGYFKEMVITIVEPALAAAGYLLEDNSIHQLRGLIRYHKLLTDEVYAFIEWQLLAFDQSPFARFQITLLRNRGLDARAITDYVYREERSLPWVIWHLFHARILPSDDVWWEFREAEMLPHLLANSGRLLFGYGIPWLEMQDVP